MARVRASLRRARLDAALAEGADPWSAGDLMARAAQLGSLSHRRNVKAGLVSLVELAHHRQPGSPYLKVRDDAVRGQSEALLALAERIGEVAPVDLAVVAQLTLLVSDPASPVFVGGSDPDGLSDVTTRCLERVAED